jgi:hypothetical protein
MTSIMGFWERASRGSALAGSTLPLRHVGHDGGEIAGPRARITGAAVPQGRSDVSAAIVSSHEVPLPSIFSACVWRLQR